MEHPPKRVVGFFLGAVLLAVCQVGSASALMRAPKLRVRDLRGPLRVTVCTRFREIVEPGKGKMLLPLNSVSRLSRRDDRQAAVIINVLDVPAGRPFALVTREGTSVIQTEAYMTQGFEVQTEYLGFRPANFPVGEVTLTVMMGPYRATARFAIVK